MALACDASPSTSTVSRSVSWPGGSLTRRAAKRWPPGASSAYREKVRSDCARRPVYEWRVIRPGREGLLSCGRSTGRRHYSQVDHFRIADPLRASRRFCQRPLGREDDTSTLRHYSELSNLTIGRRALPGFLTPVQILLATSRLTRAPNSPWSSRNVATLPASRFASSRRAQDSAFSTRSCRSFASIPQTSSVRSVSPLPPRAREFRGTVLTSAARRQHQSPERAQVWINRSPIRPSLQAGPDTMQPNASMSPQLSIPAPSYSTSD